MLLKTTLWPQLLLLIL